MYALMRKEKYESFSNESRQKIEAIRNENVIIKDIDIKDPDNPAHFIAAKLIKFTRLLLLR